MAIENPYHRADPSDCVADYEAICELIFEEREKQREWGSDEFDKTNSRNDWIAYITSYAGDAAAKVKKKQSAEGENYTEDEYNRFRINMLKVATLAIAAIEAQDKGYC